MSPRVDNPCGGSRSHPQKTTSSRIPRVVDSVSKCGSVCVWIEKQTGMLIARAAGHTEFWSRAISSSRWPSYIRVCVWRELAVKTYMLLHRIHLTFSVYSNDIYRTEKKIKNKKYWTSKWRRSLYVCRQRSNFQLRFLSDIPELP